jgi:hypothetical protein
VAARAYACSRCGACGCKLWRDYQTFLEHLKLYCCRCAGAAQGVDTAGADASGRLPPGTDQVGWLVPAVPTPDLSTFWGYTSVPEEGVAWWRALPTFPPRTPEG